ncbi:glycosyltransferase family 2 protein [Rothia sp. CCM 9416]|uniref:glycosyltransferase family 2 protein n=1 Tax=Rothia sp. CCM 9416 TaxID=3402655 RepID=UPI003ADA7311
MNLTHTFKQIKHQAYLVNQQIKIAQKARAIRRSYEFVSRYSSLNHTFTLPPLPRVPGIWGIAMVKNEADVIEQAVKHLLDQGLDHIIIVDNGSEDKTVEILHDLARTHPISVGTDNEPAYYQSEKMTWLADKAKEHGATWIVPFDADEFWFGTAGSLASALAVAREPILEALIYNQFPQPDGSWKVDATPHQEAKICFKPNRPFVVAMGNHSLIGPGKTGTSKIAILHRPWRSFEQFERKIRQGSAALQLTDLPEHLGYHWRSLSFASSDELRQVWSRLITGEKVEEDIAWKPSGNLIPLTEPLPSRWEKLPPGISVL